MAWLLGLTLFVSSLLLFAVEPMVGKALLPRLGGAPAVWTTCLLFFQGAVLAGYFYAHRVASRLPTRPQVLLHVAVLGAAFALLPATLVPAAPPPGDGTPILWLLAVLTGTIGLPAFALAATGPLLQRWYSLARPGRDPYVLTAAGSAGSLTALLGYALLVEPRSGLSGQTAAWSWGLAVVVALGAAAAVALMRATGGRTAAPVGPTSPPIPWRRRARWILLAFFPSSLVMGVTTHITTDLAPVPLLWVLPLALYLLSFVIVFGRRSSPPGPRVWLASALVVLPVLLSLLTHATGPEWLLLPLHLAAGFLAAWTCHGELARDVPPPDRLTELTLAMALGGALGGLFNAVIAPLVFPALVEYPLALVLALGLYPVGGVAVRRARGLLARLRVLRPTSPTVVAALTIALALGVRLAALPASSPLALAVFGLPLLLAYASLRHPRRLALALLGIVAGGALFPERSGEVLLRDRSFFGVSRVVDAPDGAARLILHGTTIHGRQSRDPAQARVAHSYYHRSGPVGALFEVYRARPEPGPIAVVGLGAGELTTYKELGDELTFYELDRTVARIAADPRYFTYLSDAPAPPVQVVLGDARLRLADASPGAYGLLIVDAFSSDAMPVHLLTREAVALYWSRLGPDGLLALNLSSRLVDLTEVVAELAADAGLACRVRDDERVDQGDVRDAKLASRWAVLARSEAALGPIATDPRWRRPTAPPLARVWTDDYSSLLDALDLVGPGH